MNASVMPLSVTVARPVRQRTHKSLPTPAEVQQQLPVSAPMSARIAAQRDQVRAVVGGRDPRFLVVLGPCSLHDPQAALVYAERLLHLQERVKDQLLLVMRAYVEKPRTTVGWKGMLYDPHLDGSDDLAEGLHRSRALWLQLAELGLPLATEWLQPLVAGYLDDLPSWAAIGARTSESQVHRELVSGLDMAVGFKNGTDGSLAIALDAMRSAAHPHRHFGMDAQGCPALVSTLGNRHTQLVLRGGHSGPNFHAGAVSAAREAMQAQGLEPSIMVDCSHANSAKQPERQPQVLAQVLQQRRAGERALRGVMLESHLQGGSQALSENLQFGVSITDACLGWEASAACVLEAAEQLAG
mgnify:CR=1 FL=1